MIGWVESFIVLLPGNGWFVVLGIFNQTKKSCIIAFANENNLNFVSLIKNLGNWKTWDATISFMDYKFPVNAKRLILLPWETAQKTTPIVWAWKLSLKYMHRREGLHLDNGSLTGTSMTSRHKSTMYQHGGHFFCSWFWKMCWFSWYLGVLILWSKWHSLLKIWMNHLR